MNKAEFIIYLGTKYSRVGNLRIAPNGNQVDHDIRKAELGYSFYAISVDDLVIDNDNNEISKTGTVFFKVYDEGEAGEKVVWEQKADPIFQNIPDDNSFKDTVVDWYSTNKPSEIVRFQVLEVDRDLKFAIARVFKEVSGTVTEKKVFIRKDGANIIAVPFVGM